MEPRAWYLFCFSAEPTAVGGTGVEWPIMYSVWREASKSGS
jgi:hypothetical protein